MKNNKKVIIHRNSVLWTMCFLRSDSFATFYRSLNRLCDSSSWCWSLGFSWYEKK